MRRAAKVDANHGAIVATLRKQGAQLQSLAAIGVGCPDLLVSYGGVNVLMEVKDGDKPRSAQRLNYDQALWHAYWTGPVLLVTSAEDAIQQLGQMVGRKWRAEGERPHPADCDDVTCCPMGNGADR